MTIKYDVLQREIEAKDKKIKTQDDELSDLKSKLEKAERENKALSEELTELEIQKIEVFISPFDIYSYKYNF